MIAAPTGRGREPSWLPVFAGVVLVTAVLVGATLIVVGLYAGRPTSGRPVVVAVTAPAHRTEAKVPPSRRPLVDRAAAVPMRLLIPRIGVDAAVVPLATAADGSLNPPTHWDDAGWWADGPKPGEQGPAVLAGHLDSTRGPAVFSRLGALHPGDQVTVVRRDATRASFTVNQIGEYPKDRFPTRQVYGPTRQAALRLVTCGGPFNRHTGHYQDNVIVYAVRSA